MKKKIQMFTDGACRGNPGPGGWGVILRYKDSEKHLKGAKPETTNNQMELTAVIMGLKALNQDCEIEVTTDSQYVRNGMLEWLKNWKANGWKTKNRKPVKNMELWQTLDTLVESHHVSWHWVKGHSGHRENELADQLANEAIDEMLAERNKEE